MTQPDRITDSPTRLKTTSSRSSKRRRDGLDLTEKPEGGQPSELAYRPVSKYSRTKPTTRKPRSKKVVLIGLLARKSGATMQAMMDATSWQAHSLRAALSGLRKSGIVVERRSNRKGETVYAISPAGKP